MRFDAVQIKQSHRLEDYLPARGIELRGSGTERQGRCPFHEEKLPEGKHHGHLFVNVAEQVWNCVRCTGKTGGDIIEFVQRFDNVSFNQACEKLGGVALHGTNGNGHRYKFEELKEIDCFTYVDEHKCPTRLKKKYLQPNQRNTYIQFGPGGEKLPDGLPHILYHLDEVIEAQQVCVTEGEKDADNLRKLGLCATTNDSGAEHWTDAESKPLKGKDVIIFSDNDPKGHAHLDALKTALCDVANTVRVIRIPEGFKDISEYMESLPYSELKGAVAKLIAEAAEIIDGLDMSILDACSYDHSCPPPPPVPIIKVKNQLWVATGDLVSVQGQYKAGKSALLSAMIAGGICEEEYSGVMIDLLGMSCKPSGGKAIIHFDTEQSASDHDNVIRTAIRRADLTEPPPFLLSHRTRSFKTSTRFPYLKACMERAKRRFGGVYFVLIDGIVDLFPDVNDPLGAEDNVHQLLVLAEKYDCAIILVIHENPGTTYGKTRGHLGSELQRKSMSNIKIAKDNVSEIITVWTEGARHAHLSKDSGLVFKWDANERMHTKISAENAINKEWDDKRKDMAPEVHEFFKKYPLGLSYGELLRKLQSDRGCNENGAKSRYREWHIHRLIAKDHECKWHPKYD